MINILIQDDIQVNYYNSKSGEVLYELLAKLPNTTAQLRLVCRTLETFCRSISSQQSDRIISLFPVASYGC